MAMKGARFLRFPGLNIVGAALLVAASFKGWLERSEPSGRVLTMRLVKDEAIYLWLLLPGYLVPRAYALPWLRKTAEKLDHAKNRAGQRSQRVEIQGPMSK